MSGHKSQTSLVPGPDSLAISNIDSDLELPMDRRTDDSNINLVAGNRVDRRLDFTDCSETSLLEDLWENGQSEVSRMTENQKDGSTSSLDDTNISGGSTKMTRAGKRIDPPTTGVM